MKYSFGVPAWLGALRVGLVVFAPPFLAARFAASYAAKKLGCQPEAIWIFIISGFVLLALWLGLLIVWYRRHAKK
jgi:hypothetical protein